MYPTLCSMMQIRCAMTLGLGLMACTGSIRAATPTIFAPSVISGPANDAGTAFEANGKAVYFFRSNGSDSDILVSHRVRDRWSEPAIASFSGRWRDMEPAIAPDGSYLIFASSRPLLGSERSPDGFWSGENHPGKGGNLWRVDRLKSGWSTPTRLPESINRSTAVFSPTLAADGTLYFMEAAGESKRFRLFRARADHGTYATPEPLAFSNCDWSDVDPAVAPDESFLIFSSSRPPSAKGQLNLFIVFRKEGEWSAPAPLPPDINRYAPIIEAHLGPDAHTLYFASSYVVPAAEPKDGDAGRQGLKDMQSWNNGLSNVWQVDISDVISRGGIPSSSESVATASPAAAADQAAGPASGAEDYLMPHLTIGQKIGNVYSATDAFQGDGIDESVERVSGSAVYEVVDASFDRPQVNSRGRYDGKRSSGTHLVQIRDKGRTVCSPQTAHCRPYLDTSGFICNAYFWGEPSGPLSPGMSWQVNMPTAWELGPAAMQTVTVLRVDPTNAIVILKREGHGDGPIADDPKQIKVKRGGKEFTVDVVAGPAQWSGFGVFQRGITVSDELLQTRDLRVSSKEFGSATITERQYTLLNQAPADLL
jgi:WD40-like Beta Propeller Repeat